MFARNATIDYQNEHAERAEEKGVIKKSFLYHRHSRVGVLDVTKKMIFANFQQKKSYLLSK